VPVRKPAPTRHGATQPEETRARKALLLRLRPEVIDALRQRAAAEEMTLAAYVERLITKDESPARS